MPFQPINPNALMNRGLPQQQQKDPRALMMALGNHPGFQGMAGNLPAGGQQPGQQPLQQPAQAGVRRDGQGPSSPNAPIPGLPQPAIQQTPGNSVGVPSGNPMTSRSSPADPGNPPGTSGPSAKVTFGFGDDLTTPQLQAIQAALVNSLQTAQQNSQKFQDSRKKPIGGVPPGSGVLYTGSPSGRDGVPSPVHAPAGQEAWTGPSSR